MLPKARSYYVRVQSTEIWVRITKIEANYLIQQAMVEYEFIINDCYISIIN